ncbi:hypothetical protein QMZ65_02960 [Pantoea sp. EABMAA-21]|uniref:hypothetical protein n=1 Tax=Pantoea sp. EABMAA-21 TaxID=3043302 RepID=UPI0024B55885|nr:hypothetical protein [Pantoea sp. EABMAA-21]MDI9276164.1 hypothetical protein [Pantoea sp. EABMAA-21]
MPTIIDSLVVTLGLDPSGFKKGQKDIKGGLDDTRKQAEQTAKDMEAAGKRAASFFGSIRTELLALVGVTLSIQGFKNFVTGMTDNLQQLAVNSKSLDMSAKSLDGWQRAAEAAGSSAEKMTGTLSGFQNVLTQIRTGGGQDNPLWQALSSFAGATGANFDFQNDNSEQVMRKIADNWGKLSKDAQRRFGGMFGFDNQTQQALTNGRLVTDADRFAQISRATEDATQKAQDFNRRLIEMKQNFSAAAQVLYEAVIPYVEKLIPLIEKLGIWITQHGPEIQKFFSDSADEINKVVDAVGGWQNALEILAAFVAGSWALKMLSGITRVTGGFGPLLAAMAAVSSWDKIGEAQDDAKKQGKDVGTYLVDRMKEEDKKRLSSGDTITDRLTRWWKTVTGGDSQLALSPQQQAAQDAINNSGFPALLGLPRGVRNNNPGNLNYAGQSGATKEGGENGRFAVFGSMREGISALHRQVQLYFSRGINTIESIVNKYAPSSDGNNVASYIQQLVGATGKGANETISGDDQSTIFKLIRGIINHENGKGYVTDQDIMSGIQVGSTATAMRQSAMQQQNGTSIHIGEMNVQSSAGNVDALGQDVKRSISRNSLLVPSMSGQGG